MSDKRQPPPPISKDAWIKRTRKKERSGELLSVSKLALRRLKKKHGGEAVKEDEHE